MPKFITDPIVEAYFEMLNAPKIQFSEIPDIKEVLDKSHLDDTKRQILNECQIEVESACRYLNELVLPTMSSQIAKLPEEFAQSVRKHLSTHIIDLLQKV